MCILCLITYLVTVLSTCCLHPVSPTIVTHTTGVATSTGGTHMNVHVGSQNNSARVQLCAIHTAYIKYTQIYIVCFYLSEI